MGSGPPPVRSWQLPAKVKVGEQFTAVLKISSQSALRGLPLLLGFDPQLLQVASVQEGDFFKQAAGKPSSANGSTRRKARFLSPRFAKAPAAMTPASTARARP